MKVQIRNKYVRWFEHIYDLNEPLHMLTAAPLKFRKGEVIHLTL